MDQQYSVSEAARLIGAKPRDISNLFYSRQLRDDLCPVVGGRRIIPETYLDTLTAALRRAGKLPRVQRPEAIHA